MPPQSLGALKSENEKGLTNSRKALIILNGMMRVHASELEGGQNPFQDSLEF